MAGHDRGYRRGKAARNSLDIARDAFSLLVAGPSPASLDGRGFAGLPARSIAMDEVRDRLLSRRCSQTTRDAVWAHLVECARSEGGTATVVAVGVALPALTAVATTLTASFAGDREDVVSEVIRGFLSALAELDITQPRIMVRLRWAAYRAGHRAVREALDGPTPLAPGYRSSPPTSPWGHPDLVLSTAVEAGVLSRTEADLISATRLGDTTVTGWAREHGLADMAAYQLRWRAERRLVAHLRDIQSDPGPADPVADHATRTLSSHSTRRHPSSGGRSSGALPNRQRTRQATPEDNRRSRSATVKPIERDGISADDLSKISPDSGVQDRGESPRFLSPPEAPRCA